MEKKYAVPSEGKFKNARLSLLLVIICSLLNLGFVFLGRYFVFSSTFTYELATLGMVLYEETSQVSYLVTFYIIAIVTIVPYLLCWIFSKKHVGWTIASLALFSLDTLYLLISYGPLLSEDLTILIDIALHALVIFELAVGVKAQFDMKKEIAQAQAQQLELEQIAQEQQQVQTYSKTEGLTVRTLTVTRAKSFAGCAVPIVVSVNGNEVLRVKNGETKSVEVSSAPFMLSAGLSNGFAGNSINVEESADAVNVQVKVHMGFTSGTVSIDRV